MKDLELWGGLECTVNRIGDRFGDQCARSGHDHRDDDLDLFAETRVSALRYPILWEKMAGDCPGLDARRADWSRPDAQMADMRGRGIRPIVGMVHHGSGPGPTNLLAPSFAPGLAEFAGAVAKRYDWVEDWTPVNEPGTTARFSALYGHWYPHHRTEASFWLALLNQIDGIRLSMRAIRRAIPHARLIQTEDLGRTFATAALRDQAAFDNMRRWASWDLLCGRVTRGHPFWSRLSDLGFGDRLSAIADQPCPPDVIGINHYLTSDRFLDHRLRRYEQSTRGGNDRARYVDIEAIRVLDPPPPGLAGTVREAWARYGIPIAITEVHNGSTRDEQMRWFGDAWDTAAVLRHEGVAVEAVTAWSLLGSFDWDTLLTAPGRYETGVYDVSGGLPRATAMVPLMQSLASEGERHPVQAGRGWWRRPSRLTYPAAPRPAPMREYVLAVPERQSAPPLLICGATGTLGRAFAQACRERDIAYVLTSRSDLDLSEPDTALDRTQPWAVVNATGWVRVDDAEGQADECHRINAEDAANLARACADRDIPTVHFSSDLVFGGDVDMPYREQDAPAPLNAYGRSKAAMERLIGAVPGTHMVVRTAAFFSPYDEFNFAQAVRRELRKDRPFEAAADQIISPTYVPHLVDRTLDLLIDGEDGIWHLANDDILSWFDFARRIATACGLDANLVKAISGRRQPAGRPRYSALTTMRGATLGPLEKALTEFAAHADEAPAPNRRSFATTGDIYGYH